MALLVPVTAAVAVNELVLHESSHLIITEDDDYPLAKLCQLTLLTYLILGPPHCHVHGRLLTGHVLSFNADESLGSREKAKVWPRSFRVQHLSRT